MELQDPARTRSVPDPFNEPSADIVFRSSDNVDFRVHRGILIASSELFKSMLTLPQPQLQQTELPGIEPIYATETSRVLTFLFRSVYPLVDRVSSDMELVDICAVLEAAIKYDIATSHEVMCRVLCETAKLYPMRVYAIACMLKLETVARLAAEEAVKHSHRYTENPVNVEEFTNLPAGCWHRLLEFQVKYDRTGSFSFIDPPQQVADTIGFALRPQWRKANSALFNRSDADTIITSQDHVCFRVHSAILRIVSPVLDTMLTTVERPCSNHLFGAEWFNVPHHLAIPERSSVLEIILSLCYPRDYTDLSPLTKNVEELHDIMTTAMKYSMDGVIRDLKQLYLKNAPSFRAWLSAVLYGWTDDIDAAMSRTLDMSPSELRAAYHSDLVLISTNSYRQLLQYRDRHEEIQARNKRNLSFSGGGKKKKKSVPCM